MVERVSYVKRTDLVEPVLLAGWPGLGRVANLATTFLADSLQARELARIDPEGFFRMPGIEVRAGVLRLPVKTENIFSYVRHPRPKGDLLLFHGGDQPLAGTEWEYARLVIDTAISMGVSRVYTMAAMVTQMHHKAASSVYGVVSHDALCGELLQRGVTLVREGVIEGMNGILLAAAFERGLEGVCLLGEVPHYITEMENPKATLAVLDVFIDMTGLVVDLEPLKEASQHLEGRLDLVFDQLKDNDIIPGIEDIEPSEPSDGGGPGVADPIN